MRGAEHAAETGRTMSSVDSVEEVTSVLLSASSESQLPGPSLDAALLVLGPTSSPASMLSSADTPALHESVVNA